MIPLSLAKLAWIVGAKPKWVLNAAARLGQPLDYTEPQARWLRLVRSLNRELRIPLRTAARLATEALDHRPAQGTLHLVDARADGLRLRRRFASSVFSSPSGRAPGATSGRRDPRTTRCTRRQIRAGRQLRRVRAWCGQPRGVARAVLRRCRAQPPAIRRPPSRARGARDGNRRPWMLDAATLTVDGLSLLTRHGALDLQHRLPGVGSFAAALGQARPTPAFGGDVWVLNLPALVEVRRTRRTREDMARLPVIETLQAIPALEDKRKSFLRAREALSFVSPNTHDRA